MINILREMRDNLLLEKMELTDMMLEQGDFGYYDALCEIEEKIIELENEIYELKREGE
jgi:hypothetical protein